MEQNNIFSGAFSSAKRRSAVNSLNNLACRRDTFAQISRALAATRSLQAGSFQKFAAFVIIWQGSESSFCHLHRERCQFSEWKTFPRLTSCQRRKGISAEFSSNHFFPRIYYFWNVIEPLLYSAPLGWVGWSAGNMLLKYVEMKRNWITNET